MNNIINKEEGFYVFNLLDSLNYELKFFGKHKVINAKNLGKKILSLPISEEHSLKEIYYVVKKIKSFFKNEIKY